MNSCGALSTGGASFEGNVDGGSTIKSIVTKDVDSISGKSFSMVLYVQRRRVGKEFFFTMGDNTVMRGGVVVSIWWDNRVGFNLNDDFTNTDSTFPDDTGVWVHWAFVYNKIGNGMSIFRDGVSQTPQAAAASNPDYNGGTSGGPSSATGPIHLGVNKWDTTNKPFNGNMDEVRV